MSNENGRKRKKAGELTGEGLARRLFPSEVRKKVKQEVEEKPPKSKKKDDDPSIDDEGTG